MLIRYAAQHAGWIEDPTAGSLPVESKRFAFKCQTAHPWPQLMTLLASNDSRAMDDCAVGAAAITRTLARVQMGVKFSASYMSVGLGVVVHVTQKPINWWNFLRPFDKSMWIFFILMCTAIPIMLWVVERLTVYGTIPLNKHAFMQWKLTTFMSMLIVFNLDKFPARGLPSRLMVVMFCFFCLICVATYVANLTAFIASDMNTVLIDSTNDLKSSTIAIWPAYAARVRIHYQVEAETFNITHPDLYFLRAVEEMQAGKVMGYAGDFQTLAQEVLAYDPDCQLKMLPDIIEPMEYAFAFHSQFPDDAITEFNIGFLFAQERGELAFLDSQFFPNPTDRCQSQQTRGTNAAIEIEQLAGAFIILGVAAAASILLTAGMMVIHYIRRRQGASGWCAGGMDDDYGADEDDDDPMAEDLEHEMCDDQLGLPVADGGLAAHAHITTVPDFDPDNPDGCPPPAFLRTSSNKAPNLAAAAAAAAATAAAAAAAGTSAKVPNSNRSVGSVGSKGSRGKLGRVSTLKRNQTRARKAGGLAFKNDEGLEDIDAMLARVQVSRPRPPVPSPRLAASAATTTTAAATLPKPTGNTFMMLLQAAKAARAQQASVGGAGKANCGAPPATSAPSTGDPEAPAPPASDSTSTARPKLTAASSRWQSGAARALLLSARAHAASAPAESDQQSAVSSDPATQTAPTPASLVPGAAAPPALNTGTEAAPAPAPDAAEVAHVQLQPPTVATAFAAAAAAGRAKSTSGAVGVQGSVSGRAASGVLPQVLLQASASVDSHRASPSFPRHASPKHSLRVALGKVFAVSTINSGPRHPSDRGSDNSRFASRDNSSAKLPVHHSAAVHRPSHLDPRVSGLLAAIDQDLADGEGAPGSTSSPSLAADTGHALAHLPSWSQHGPPLAVAGAVGSMSAKLAGSRPPSTAGRAASGVMPRALLQGSASVGSQHTPPSAARAVSPKRSLKVALSKVFGFSEGGRQPSSRGSDLATVGTTLSTSQPPSRD